MSGIELTKVMQRLYASEITCAVQSQWDAGFVVSIGGDTRYGKPQASETNGGLPHHRRPTPPALLRNVRRALKARRAAPGRIV